MGNLRRRPWLALLLPVFLLLFARAARRAARDADLVHAHWLPSGLAALATRKPFVVQLWGHGRRAGAACAVAVSAASSPRAARDCRVRAPCRRGARAWRTRGARHPDACVEIPLSVGEPDEPPHVLFVGRLSPEKGIEEFVAATDGLPRVIVGAGPVEVPEALGFVPHSELGPYYQRSAVVCVPSRREGYGVVAREAMAHGRPVAATAVDGLAEAVEDGVTGLLVPPDDAAALRETIERLLGDAGLARAARRSRPGPGGRTMVERGGRTRARGRLLGVHRNPGHPPRRAIAAFQRLQQLWPRRESAARDDGTDVPALEHAHHLGVGQRAGLEAERRRVDKRARDASVGEEGDDRVIRDDEASGSLSRSKTRATATSSALGHVVEHDPTLLLDVAGDEEEGERTDREPWPRRLARRARRAQSRPARRAPPTE